MPCLKEVGHLYFYSVTCSATKIFAHTQTAIQTCKQLCEGGLKTVILKLIRQTPHYKHANIDPQKRVVYREVGNVEKNREKKCCLEQSHDANIARWLNNENKVIHDY